MLSLISVCMSCIGFLIQILPTTTKKHNVKALKFTITIFRLGRNLSSDVKASRLKCCLKKQHCVFRSTYGHYDLWTALMFYKIVPDMQHLAIRESGLTVNPGMSVCWQHKSHTLSEDLFTLNSNKVRQPERRKPLLWRVTPAENLPTLRMTT